MAVRRAVANPRVSALRDQSALLRGPLVYCFEQSDNPGLDIPGLALPLDAEFEPEYDSALLGGVTRLQGKAPEPDMAIPYPLMAIPYYAWANREPGAMTVWVANFSPLPRV